MEGRKKLLLIAIFGVMTVALATGVYLDYLSYQQLMQGELSRYPVEIQPYIDFAPYFSTFRGSLWIAMSVFVYAVFGLALEVQRAREKKPK